ncbi:ABC transporter ATP-binding protein [Candidatus Pelagibacter bacterium]|nr:ABC transporter ATP-binding protein [Candidatus Pelagibacter bacterium]MDC0455651.1 ABC transporter ATP-binding protein [Candidatus Pelagibacter sp.]MDC0627712.1 ABC transporter ATP-binding protein [Candidatus Pelagibacter sp.]
MATLKINDINKNFGKTEVLKGINLDIKHGEFLVLLGPSGCGKSTLLNTIAGLETANSGDILIDDHIVNNMEPSDRDIALVFQSYALYPAMTVRKNVTFGLEQRKTPKEKIEKALDDVSNLLQITQLLDRKPSQLSGGQRQRVAMGRALVRDPKIFLFDEPLSNLDAKLRVEMRREIKKLHQKLGTTIVYVTHDQTEAMSLGTNIAIMDHGLIQQCDTPKNIYNKPESVFVADFIGSPSMNLIEGKLTKDNNDIVFMPNGSNDSTKISVGNYSFKNKFDGNEVSAYLGIRPEHIYFEKINTDCFEISLKSELLEYTGHEQIVTFDYFGQQVLGKFASTLDININKDLKLNIDMSQISLFDKDTKNRI